MEELKNRSPQQVTAQEETRKPYEPPTAEIILLAPEEELAGWQYDSHNEGETAANRWALQGWGLPLNGDNIASYTIGKKENAWSLPEN